MTLEVHIESERRKHFAADLCGGVCRLPVCRVHKAHMRPGYACLFKKLLGFFEVLRIVVAFRT